ncbi:MAG TPA: sigma-70 family RNA polymerase sigma factor [Polyangiaceae bacterium]|nr:sigma-70 family RNA polymerase sigma factor [Polyangiaceae bacterium]
MASNANQIETLGAVYSASQNRLRARLVGLGVPLTDVEDLRHEVFVVALRRRAALSSDAAAAAWLNQVCEFVALAYRRKAYRRREVQKELPELDAEPVVVASGEGAGEQPSEQLHRALAELEPLERDLLALHLAAEVPFRTLAELHGCDVKTVRKRFQAAAKRLRRILEAEVPRQTAGAGRSLRAEPAPSSRGMALAQLGQSPSVAVGSLGNVLITCWRGALTPAALELVLQAGEALMHRVGPRIACLSIVDAAWPVPHFDERQRIFEALGFLRKNCLALSLSGAHPNLRMAEQILRGLGFLLQARYPLHAAQELPRAAAWLLSHDGVTLAESANSVERLVVAARAVERA